MTLLSLFKFTIRQNDRLSYDVLLPTHLVCFLDTGLNRPAIRQTGPSLKERIECPDRKTIHVYLTYGTFF